MCIFAFACRVRWNARLPFPRSATKGGLWETCGHLGMWWVTRSLPIEFFISISIFFLSLSRSLSRRPAHIQTHQLSDVESSSPAGVVKRRFHRRVSHSLSLEYRLLSGLITSQISRWVGGLLVWGWEFWLISAKWFIRIVCISVNQFMESFSKYNSQICCHKCS